jgi:hypothetical protein
MMILGIITKVDVWMWLCVSNLFGGCVIVSAPCTSQAPLSYYPGNVMI